MIYYNEYDKELAKLTNLGTSFDVNRKEFGDVKKVVLYFLSSLANSKSVFELNYSIMNMNEESEFSTNEYRFSPFEIITIGKRL